MKERKIGETFEFEGKKIEVKEAGYGECDGCILDGKCTRSNHAIVGKCGSNDRDDGKNVIFAEVQEQPQETEEPKERKIGEVFDYQGMKLKVKEADILCEGCVFEEDCFKRNKQIVGECENGKRKDGKKVVFVDVTEQKKERLNLCNVLKYCPEGEQFWSPMFDNVTLVDIDQEAKNIKVLTKGQYSWNINNDGTITIDGDTSPEVMLFPSREQRDWTKVKYEKKKERFDPQTLKPFDRVLCQPDNYSKWQCNFFSHIHPDYKNLDYPVHGMTNTFMYCIPYNDETKHLLDTTDEAPDFYRYWDD